MDTATDRSRLRQRAAAGWAWAKPHVSLGFTRTAAFVAGPLRTSLRMVAQTLGALIVLFFEWGWRPLERSLSALRQFAIFARLEAAITQQPPYGALACFAAPAICLVPVKLFALYLFATGHPALGVGLIIAAKVAGTAVVARIFVLTRPRLMQIGWFARLHDRFMPWKEAMFAAIRSSPVWRQGRIIRVAVKRGADRVWRDLKPQRDWVRAQAHVWADAIRGWFSKRAGVRR